MAISNQLLAIIFYADKIQIFAKKILYLQKLNPKGFST